LNGRWRRSWLAAAKLEAFCSDPFAGAPLQKFAGFVLPAE
jgi:hypothetical protein